mgnify:CR=1 FL=1
MQRQANGPVKNPSHSLLVQSLGSHRGNGQEAFRGLKAKVDGSAGHRCVRRRRHSRLGFTGPPGTATPFVIGYPGTNVGLSGPRVHLEKTIVPNYILQ